MNKLIIIFLIFTAIEFNLQWTGYEHEPNWVEVKNEEEIVEVNDYWEKVEEVYYCWEKVEEVYYWNVFDLDGNLITFLNFWTTYD